VTNPTYSCPDCRVALEGLHCPRCGRDFPSRDGVPRFLSTDPRFERTTAIATAYDDFYTERTAVWEAQGRTPAHYRYLAALMDRFPHDRALEIGCGEGYLLEAWKTGGEVYATDLSVAAIAHARTRADAHFSIALAERLPFPADRFDLVASVGVMEHFLEIEEALAEIRRILRPGGHQVALIHVRLTLRERIPWLISAFVLPRPRPVRFLRWLVDRLRFLDRFRRRGSAVPRQPVQNRYTADEWRELIERSGFTVTEVIRERDDPGMPPAGPWVAIYVARK
jgi:SAM-dependent methyltransferase